LCQDLIAAATFTAVAAAVLQSHEGLAAREMIATLFDDWNEALATKNPEKVANLYAHDAVLLPTVSNEVSSDSSDAPQVHMTESLCAANTALQCMVYLLNLVH
jgi:hypothetical protein